MTASDILVVLPTLGDRLETLSETLAAIDAQRAEVALTLALVVPEKATKARALAKKHGALIIDDPKAGMSAAINAGIAARTSETYYAWMGDDDLFRPGGLARLKGMLDAEPRAVVAYGGCEYIDPTGKVLWTSAAGGLARTLLPWGPNLIPHPGSMIRLDDLQAVGCFKNPLKYSMDLDVFLALRKRGPFVSTKTPVSAFRWHPDSLTVANRRASSLEAEAVKRSYLPAVVRPVSYLWSYPVRWASSFAAKRVNAAA